MADFRYRWLGTSRQDCTAIWNVYKIRRFETEVLQEQRQRSIGEYNLNNSETEVAGLFEWVF